MPRHEIILKPAVVRDLDKLRRYDAARILDAVETHLTHAPTRESKSRIKKLRGIRNPDYRLRVDDFRVFYTVDKGTREVHVLRAMHKDGTREYYEELRQ